MIPAAALYAQASQSRTSDKGLFVVSYQAGLQPVIINRIHNWDVHVETADGSPVDNATISLLGGMPVHNHGLPTMPLATQNLGNGDYLVEGMKFHMNGWWQVTFSVSVGDRSDSVTFDLQL